MFKMNSSGLTPNCVLRGYEQFMDKRPSVDVARGGKRRKRKV